MPLIRRAVLINYVWCRGTINEFVEKIDSTQLAFNGVDLDVFDDGEVEYI